MKQDEMTKQIRSKLREDYSERSLKKAGTAEVRFVVDAYMVQGFSKLDILKQLPDERIYRQRYNGFEPLVLAAIIYDYSEKMDTRIFQVADMVSVPGSPAIVYGLDLHSFRQQAEELHNRGWLKYETTHNLDQIRILPGFNAYEFLTAYYEDRIPGAANDSKGELLI